MAGRILSDGVPADEIRIAPNGADALRLARSEPVDLVVLDVSMPGLMGSRGPA